MNINNVPSYAKSYKYWVVRDCGKDGLWFYGAYKNVKTVKAIRKTIANGKIYVNKTVGVK